MCVFDIFCIYAVFTLLVIHSKDEDGYFHLEGTVCAHFNFSANFMCKMKRNSLSIEKSKNIEESKAVALPYLKQSLLSYKRLLTVKQNTEGMYLCNKYKYLQPSWLGQENTLTAPLQRGKTPPASVLNMTLNHLMVRLQPWSSGKSRVSLYCYCSQVHSHPELKHLIKSYLWVK